jgi:hypothetical protein
LVTSCTKSAILFCGQKVVWDTTKVWWYVVGHGGGEYGFRERKEIEEEKRNTKGILFLIGSQLLSLYVSLLLNIVQKEEVEGLTRHG